MAIETKGGVILGRLSKSKIWFFTFISFFFVFLLIFSNLNLTLSEIEYYFRSSTFLAIIGILLLYAIKSVTMTIPNSVLYVTAGLMFPTWLALLVSYIGLAISLSIGYLMGCKLGENRVYMLLAKRKCIMNFLDLNKNDMISLCFITQLIALPFGFVSFLFGALKTPFLKYMIASLLGVSPTLIPIVFSGAAITNPFSPEFLIPFSVSLGIMGLAFLIYKKKTTPQEIN